MTRSITLVFSALVSTLVFTSCQRQQALFQRSAPVSYERNVTQTTVATPTPEPVAATQQTTQAVDVIRQVRQQLDETVASNSQQLVVGKTLSKRVARVQNLLNVAEQKVAASNASAQKLTLKQRVFMKKMDTKIHQHVAPEKTMAMNKNTKLGLILILAGLLAQFIPFVNILGIIAIVVGLVFLIIGVANS